MPATRFEHGGRDNIGAARSRYSEGWPPICGFILGRSEIWAAGKASDLFEVFEFYHGRRPGIDDIIRVDLDRWSACMFLDGEPYGRLITIREMIRTAINEKMEFPRRLAAIE